LLPKDIFPSLFLLEIELSIRFHFAPFFYCSGPSLPSVIYFSVFADAFFLPTCAPFRSSLHPLYLFPSFPPGGADHGAEWCFDDLLHRPLSASFCDRRHSGSIRSSPLVGFWTWESQFTPPFPFAFFRLCLTCLLLGDGFPPTSSPKFRATLAVLFSDRLQLCPFPSFVEDPRPWPK